MGVGWRGRGQLGAGLLQEPEPEPEPEQVQVQVQDQGPELAGRGRYRRC